MLATPGVIPASPALVAALGSSARRKEARRRRRASPAMAEEGTRSRKCWRLFLGRMLIFLGGPDVTGNRCCPHFLALVTHPVRGSEVKNNSGGTERALGNPFGKELAQGETRHLWLTVELFEKNPSVLFCFCSGRQSHLYADLFKVQLT